MQPGGGQAITPEKVLWDKSRFPALPLKIVLIGKKTALFGLGVPEGGKWLVTYLGG